MSDLNVQICVKFWCGLDNSMYGFVRIFKDLMYGFVRIFKTLMYGPDTTMYGFVRIFFQNLGSHPENTLFLKLSSDLNMLT